MNFKTQRNNNTDNIWKYFIFLDNFKTFNINSQKDCKMHLEQLFF